MRWSPKSHVFSEEENRRSRKVNALPTHTTGEQRANVEHIASNTEANILPTTQQNLMSSYPPSEQH
jgi:hypothetical protein